MAAEKRRNGGTSPKKHLVIRSFQAYLRYNFRTKTGYGDDIESLGAPRDAGERREEFEYWHIRHQRRVGVFATVRIYSHDLMTPRGVHVRYEANDMADLWDFTPIVQMVQWAQTCSIVVTWFDRDLRQIDPPDLRPPSPENIARAEQAEAELAEVREELRELREQLSKPKRPYRRRMKGESEVGSDEHDGHLSQDNDEGAGC